MLNRCHVWTIIACRNGIEKHLRHSIGHLAYFVKSHPFASRKTSFFERHFLSAIFFSRWRKTVCICKNILRNFYNSFCVKQNNERRSKSCFRLLLLPICQRLCSRLPPCLSRTAVHRVNAEENRLNAKLVRQNKKSRWGKNMKWAQKMELN